MNANGVHGKLINNLHIIDKRMTAAGLRLGLRPCETEYDLVSDAQMNANLIYVAMPTHYRHWRYGKQAAQGPRMGHVFEVVINSDPSVCYLGLTNDIVMQALVIAHAKWGHVDFFANNYLFRETLPKSVIERFAVNKAFIDRLIAHPDWRWDGVEAYLDSAHALESHVGWLPSLPDVQVPDKVQREELMELLRKMKGQFALTKVTSDREIMGRDIQELESRLKCHPLVPTADLLGFLADPDNCPHLPAEARELILMVREQARYFQPQGRTKFMNEGWATYWEMDVMKAPECALPFNMTFDAARYWAMFDSQPVNWYLDPYALGELLWRHIDEKFGFDEGKETVKYKSLELTEDGTLVEGKSWKSKTIAKRNRDKMFEVRRTYGDNRFLDEFICKEFFEGVNLKVLAWMRGSREKVGLMEQINKKLKDAGWGPAVVFDPLPDTLEGLMNVVQTWLNMAQNSQMWHTNAGLPQFPVHVQTLQQMATILQLIGAFDEDWHQARRQLVLRTGYNSIPHIALVDTGRFTDGVWTLQHTFDPTFGPLLQSDARDTLKHFRFLCGAPVRLLTMEQPVDWAGRPYGDPVPFEYFTEDGETVKEQYL